MVEHGPEKAGVGGSSPPLTTGNVKNRDLAKCRIAVFSYLKVARAPHRPMLLDGAIATLTADLQLEPQADLRLR